MDLDAALTLVLDALGSMGILALIVALAQFIVDWVNEQRPRT